MLKSTPNRNESYLGNINVKRDGVQHSFTEWEIKEYLKCSSDPVYFCKNYLKVISLWKTANQSM